MFYLILLKIIMMEEAFIMKKNLKNLVQVYC